MLKIKSRVKKILLIQIIKFFKKYVILIKNPILLINSKKHQQIDDREEACVYINHLFYQAFRFFY